MEEQAPEQEPSVVIGVGASAGGLDALTKFFAEAGDAEADTAFIVVQHLDPNHESLMVDILGRATRLTVEQADEGKRIRGGVIYMIPPGRFLQVKDRSLHLSRRHDGESDKHQGARLSVDVLFRSMAEEYGDRAVGVVLSGTGGDGAAGLRAIAAAGGLCAAQAPATAEHSGMPHNAVETGVLHVVRPVTELRRAILESLDRTLETTVDESDEPNFRELFSIVRARRGTDFSQYKRNTISRRLGRRMGMLGIESLDEYIKRIREDEQELELLCRDMLIGVTSFFRDRGAFDCLKQELGPRLFEEAGGEVRAWVAGCATGEEAYSVAMVLNEVARAMGSTVPIQVFASDIDKLALDYARRGAYPESVVEDIPGDLLSRYFTAREEGGYEVGRKLREIVVFAPQDLLSDPPFSRLNLITCRNLLIYLKQETQDSVLSIFHFALLPGGFLLLGGSESVRQQDQKFQVISREHRVFQRHGNARGSLPTFPVRQAAMHSTPTPHHHRTKAPPSLKESVQSWVNERFAPASVVVTRQHTVVYYSSTAHRFLRIPEGEPTANFFDMVESAPGTRIRTMLGRVMRSGQGEPPRPLALRNSDKEGGRALEARVGVLPFDADGQDEDLFVITFEEISLEHNDRIAELEESAVVAQLEHELRVTREDLQGSVEEMEATNEELKASNEETMSVNEELQTANEELETSKEELQSLNEEITTVNAQLREKLKELETAHNDITNLLDNTEIGVLFLDEELRIKRFTPGLTDLFRMAPNDIDRHVDDIARRFKCDHDLATDVAHVLKKLDRIERRVRSDAGAIYLQRILPYRTHENRINGVVVTYTDVTKITTAMLALERAREQQSALAEVGTIALTEDLDDVFDAAVRAAAKALDADFAKVLKLTHPEGPLKIVAGVGWDIGADSQPVSAGRESQAGFTLMQEQPVVVSDLETETRFSGPPLLTDHGVRSGISCIIADADGAWGVLGIHSRVAQSFSAEDVDFVKSLAAVLGQAIRMRHAAAELRHETERLEFTLNAAGIGTWVYWPSTDRVEWDERLHNMYGTSPAEFDNSIESFWRQVHPDDADALRVVLRECIADRTTIRADFRIVLKSGKVRWMHTAGALFDTPGGETILRGVNVDITVRKELEAILNSQKVELEESVAFHGQLADARLEDIRRLSHQMVIAESLERRKLANELHDNLSQSLNLALLKLKTVRGESTDALPPELDQAAEIIQQASDITRSIIGQLSPQVLEELGLVAGIDWLAEEIERVYGLHVQVERSSEPRGIAHEQRLILYRAVRELLINAAKHAEVERVELRMTLNEEHFMIRIRDEGKGFDSAATLRDMRTHGLFATRERIDHMGGELHIDSERHQGTSVTIILPEGRGENDGDRGHEHAETTGGAD